MAAVSNTEMREEQLQAEEAAQLPLGTYLGFMSGTSMDGVDAALLATDGQRICATGPFMSAPYSDDLRERVKAILGAPDLDRDGQVGMAITEAHVALAAQLLDSSASKNHLRRFPLKAIGFHGQTVFHNPAAGITVQIGDPNLLHDAFRVPVVYDFRTADVQAGGQGAPLAPIYHHVLCHDIDKPVAVLNLGGVANLTLLPSPDPASMVAFDCGPGNGLIDDWMSLKTGASFDQDGATAARGLVSQVHLDRFLGDPFFKEPVPKSLDRMAWSMDYVSDLSVEDGAATLTAITAETVAEGLALLPATPTQVVVCGGGRKNRTLMDMLNARSAAVFLACEELGWNGDAVEAQAFAYMAARCLNDLPSTFPGTTGVSAPLVVGQRLGV